MSEKKKKILSFMIRKLSTMKYGYRDIVEGCYLAAIKNYHYVAPEEGMDDVVDSAISILKGEK